MERVEVLVVLSCLAETNVQSLDLEGRGGWESRGGDLEGVSSECIVLSSEEGEGLELGEGEEVVEVGSEGRGFLQKGRRTRVKFELFSV